MVKLLTDRMITSGVLFLMGLNMTMVRILCSLTTLIWLTICLYHLIFFFFFFGNKQRFSLVFCCYSVFDVDIGDGEPIRKLPYNRSGIFFLGPVFLWLIIIAVSVALHFPFHLLHTHTPTPTPDRSWTMTSPSTLV